MLIGVGTDLLAGIVQLDQTTTLPPKRKEVGGKVCCGNPCSRTVQERESQEGQMDRHKQMKTVDDNKWDTDRRDNINIDALSP